MTHTFTQSLSRITFCLLWVACFVGCATQASKPSKWRSLNGERPLIIAHRGDSGQFPEHTLAAYESALVQGVDFIEPDIVLTRDRVPICRHDFYLSTTTDIASRQAFADRKSTVGERNDWLVPEFTLLEIKSLRAIQPVKTRPPAASLLHVPTLGEVIELTNRFNASTTEEPPAGIYIEIKKPELFRKLGLDPSKAVLDTIAQFKAAGDTPPIILQCFDRQETERLAAMSDLPVIWLASKPVDLNNLPKGIAGLGLSKQLIEIEQVDGEMRSPLIEAAHERGLVVHVWTFRDDEPVDARFDNAEQEIMAYLEAGVDGVFTDFPETGINARRAVEETWLIPPMLKRAGQKYN